MKILLDRVIVRKLPKDDVTIGGIALVGKAGDTLERGVVLFVGPGRKSPEGQVIPMTLKVGDKVIFEKPPQAPAILNGEEVLVMYEAEIIGVL